MNQYGGRIFFLRSLFLALAVAVVGRAVQIQLTAPPQLSRLADRQFKTRITALPRRGVIYDRHGEGLAVSVKVHSLYLRPEVLRQNLAANKGGKAQKPTVRQISQALALILRMPEKQITHKILSKKSFIWLKRKLSEKEEKYLRELDLDRFNDGLGLAEESRRHYPNRDLAAHALGTVNIDGQGIEGLELYYNAILAGEQTRISSIKDAMGRSVFRDDKGILAFKNGQSLQLTLDKTVQYEAEKILKHAVHEFNARAATAIVADVETGDIIAMANYPTYDPNSPRGASQDSRRNRAVTDIYEPGSTLKPLITALALEKGIPAKTQIYCEKGKFKVGDRTISEAETHEKFEWLSLTEIIKLSSNIGAAKLALMMGPGPLTSGLQKLGLGTKTGLDLPGEVSGLSFPLKDLQSVLSSQVRLANVGFGHGITLTPLQLLSYYGAVANNGVWVKPRFVKKVINDDGTTAHVFDNQGAQAIFSPSIAKNVTSMLAAVTGEGGTGTAARLESWSVAGKTGTAQKIDPVTRRYSRSKYIASFAGFAPVTKPKLVALVIMDEPTKKYYASETAAPVWREIMRTALIRQNVPADLETNDTILQKNNLSIQAIRQELEHRQNNEQRPSLPLMAEVNEQQQVRLPDMRGMTIREVMKTVSPHGLDVQILGSGILKDQSPAAGEWLNQNARVRFVFDREAD